MLVMYLNIFHVAIITFLFIVLLIANVLYLNLLLFSQAEIKLSINNKKCCICNSVSANEKNIHIYISFYYLSN